MFVYFDKNGVLKEIINDDSKRVGSGNANKIYVYIDGFLSISNLSIVIQRSDGTKTTETAFISNVVEQEIPYDKDRDMKYFEDFTTYKFYYYTLTSSDLSKNGLTLATVRLYDSTTTSKIFAEGLITFNVESSVVKTDNEITLSQYDYLYWYIASNIGNLSKIISGELVVPKAKADQYGNVIDTTYETIEDATTKYTELSNRIKVIEDDYLTSLDKIELLEDIYILNNELQEKIKPLNNAVTNLTNNLNTEIQERTNADTELSTKIDNNKTLLEDEIDSVDKNCGIRFAYEKERAMAEESSLSSRILSIENDYLKNSDKTNLQNQINTKQDKITVTEFKNYVNLEINGMTYSLAKYSTVTTNYLLTVNEEMLLDADGLYLVHGE